MWNDLQVGWKPPETLTREMYENIKNNKDEYSKSLVAIAGFCATYNAKWFGGYAGVVKTKINTYRDYYSESVRNILKQVDKLMDVKFIHADYTYFTDYKNALIYCDPPYQGTTQYGSSRDFDYDRFWNWVRKMSEHNGVFVSEYNAPDDFECIYEKTLTTTLDKNSRKNDTEKLFVLRNKYNY
jgi:DNA adenine methylase